MFKPIWIPLVVFHALCLSVKCDSCSEEQHILDHLLINNYDPHVPPIQNDEPVVVDVKISVLSLRSLSEQNLCFSADLFVHYTWFDHRLNISSDKPQKIVLGQDWRNRLWLPETVFKNGITGEYSSSLYKTTYFIINEQKQVFQASRVTVVLLCDFDFKNYPHDSNVCGIDLMALSYQTKKMVFRNTNFSLSKHLFNNDFTITAEGRSQCKGKNDVGEFACIRNEIRFSRNYGHFLLKTYIPSCIIVLTAIFGFWLSSGAYPQRIALYMSAMIALFTMQIQNTNTIKPSYVVSIQIWMTSCVVFVFICLLEFLVSSTIDMKDRQLEAETAKRTHDQQPLNGSTGTPSVCAHNGNSHHGNHPCDLNAHKLVAEHGKTNAPVAQFVEIATPTVSAPPTSGFTYQFKKKWSLVKIRLVRKGYTSRRIDNAAKFWVTALFAVWIVCYVVLISNRT